MCKAYCNKFTQRRKVKFVQISSFSICYQNILQHPIIINKIPEIVDKMLSGILRKEYNFCPQRFPRVKKPNCKQLVNNGNIMKKVFIILKPIPIQKLSKERAKPKNKASLESIVLDLSKSEEIGFLIIFMVIPKHLIKKEYIFSLSDISKSLSSFMLHSCFDFFND